MTEPLTPEQRRAAEQLGQGATQQAVADELGVSLNTVRRLVKNRPDFAALVEEAREDPPTTDERMNEKTPRSVLEEALLTTKADGSPTSFAMNAAIALAKLPDDAASSGPVIERVYVLPDHTDHDQVLAILDRYPPNISVGVVDGDDDLKKLADRVVPDADGAKVYILSAGGSWGPSQADSPPPRGSTRSAHGLG